MKIELPEKVDFIIRSLSNKGYEAFAVGGCIRDILLGQEPHDWDICTSALPEEIKESISGDSAYSLKIIETGIKHGTITILLDGEPFEVTTFRVDGEYLDNRHPSRVTFVRNLKEDLQRRDFTINAMAYNTQSGLVDYFHGRDDLKQGIIRCVGEPEQRFREDGLRILRALRFAAVFNFEIEAKTSQALMDCRGLLENIAGERIQTEFQRLLCGAGAARILDQYFDVVTVFLPELKPMKGFQQNTPYHNKDVWSHTLATLDHIPRDKYLRWTMLLHDSGKPLCYTEDRTGRGHFYGHNKISVSIAEAVMKRMKYDNETARIVTELIRHHDDSIAPQRNSVKRWMNKIGEEQLRRLLFVKEADAWGKPTAYLADRMKLLEEIGKRIDEIKNAEMCFRLKDLAVSGNDLIAAGFQPGPQIGRVLDYLLDQVLDENLENDREELLKAAEEFTKKP